MHTNKIIRKIVYSSCPLVFFLQKWINKNVLALAWMYKYQFEFKQIQIPNHCRIICRKFIRIHTQVKTAEPRTLSRAIFSFFPDNFFPWTQRCVAGAKRCWEKRDGDKARCKDRDKNRVIDKYKWCLAEGWKGKSSTRSREPRKLGRR